MNYGTARLVESLGSRPAPVSARQSVVAPASRRASRLDGAIVVNPVAPASPPTSTRRSDTAPVVAPPTPKVVRIPRDPAVAAAEAERKLQAKAAEEAELVRKAQEARVAAEAKAVAARVAVEQQFAAERVRRAEAARVAEAEAEATARADREAAELVQRQQRELRDARDAFIAEVRRALS